MPGGALKMVGFTEGRKIHAFNTGSAGLVETREGDFVMIVVVRKWEDAPAALAELAGRELSLLESRSEEP